jgi:hypothetical protein
MPPYDFKQQSRRDYKSLEIRKHWSGAATYGKTSKPNVINFRPSIIQLSKAHKRISIVKGLVTMG